MTPEGSVESILASGNAHGRRSTSAGEDEIAAGHIQVGLVTVANLPRLLTARDAVTMTSRSATAAGGTRRLQTEGLECLGRKIPAPDELCLKA